MEPNQKSDLHKQIVGKILWLSRKHLQRVNQRMEEAGLGGASAFILVQLGFHGEMNQKELARHIDVTPATISQALKPMVKGGLVERTSDESDARAFRLRLTDAGRQARDTAKRVFSQVDGELLSSLSEDEQQTLSELLVKIENQVRSEQV